MSADARYSQRQAFARHVRQQVWAALQSQWVQLDEALRSYLDALMLLPGTMTERQERRDAVLRYQQHRAALHAQLHAVCQALQAQVQEGASSKRAAALDFDSFELLSDDVVDNQIAASRLALTLQEEIGKPFDGLRLRLQALEERDMPSDDGLRPDLICRKVVETWHGSGLTRADWSLVLDPFQKSLGLILAKAYTVGVDLLESKGIAPAALTAVRSPARSRGTGAVTASGMADMSEGAGLSTAQAGIASGLNAAAVHAPTSRWAAGAVSVSQPLTASASLPPVLRARHRANQVMLQLRRFLGQVLPVMPADPVAVAGAHRAEAEAVMSGALSSAAEQSIWMPPASAALAQALAAQQQQAQVFYSTLSAPMVFTPAAAPQVLAQAMGEVREQSVELKRKAETDQEKATIELVGLMFQSILSEDRLPPAIRVWFARLQVPVLRVALADPEFFSNLDHPARVLIDRMGSCVMGFDATAINGSALEAEIRRIVQVIEQYPDTGRRVFQLVHEEFQRFLAQFLTQEQSTARVVGVAQQLEQKETLVIQYTIELRNQLKDMPVHPQIRDFLFKVWVEVLALSAVRLGSQDADTIALRRAAADLIWAASAKPSRADRAKVIQALPDLLQRLRGGIALLGTTEDEIEAQIKALTDLLAEAFLSRNATIPQEQIDALSRGLETLESSLPEAEIRDLPFDAESLEVLLGIESDALQVMPDVASGDLHPDALSWAQSLPLAAWFTLEHNGHKAQVQYAWHSQRGLLHLFTAVHGMSYLLPLRRLAAYIQAGLLMPHEEEGLLVRATRDALTKLDANPERLLA